MSLCWGRSRSRHAARSAVAVVALYSVAVCLMASTDAVQPESSYKMGVEDAADRLYRNKVILAPMVRAVSILKYLQSSSLLPLSDDDEYDDVVS